MAAENPRGLDGQNHRRNNRNDRPEPGVLQQDAHARAGAVVAASGRGALGQSAVDDDPLHTLYGGDRNEGGVQVGAVADDVAQILGIIVLVTAAHLLGKTAAVDRLRLVLPARGIVEAVGVVVVVHVGAGNPKGSSHTETGDEGNGDKARGGSPACLVGNRRAASIESPSAVCGGGAASRGCFAAGRATGRAGSAATATAAATAAATRRTGGAGGAASTAAAATATAAATTTAPALPELVGILTGIALLVLGLNGLPSDGIGAWGDDSLRGHVGNGERPC